MKLDRNKTRILCACGRVGVVCDSTHNPVCARCRRLERESKQRHRKHLGREMQVNFRPTPIEPYPYPVLCQT